MAAALTEGAEPEALAEREEREERGEHREPDLRRGLAEGQRAKPAIPASEPAMSIA